MRDTLVAWILTFDGRGELRSMPDWHQDSLYAPHLLDTAATLGYRIEDSRVVTVCRVSPCAPLAELRIDGDRLSQEYRPSVRLTFRKQQP